MPFGDVEGLQCSYENTVGKIWASSERNVLRIR